ncbi:MAG: 50S ribosomal protein L10 [Thaumarchaeota archaeon]|nr:50S ribosomal protein L10 [Nitrososphaerota archaeon]
MQVTERVYKPKKVQAIERVAALAKKRKVIAVAGIGKVRAAQIMGLKKSFRNQLDIIVAKNTLTNIALSKMNLPNADALLKELKGQNVLILTDMNPFKLYLILQKGRVSLPARAGDIATEEIVIPAGNTGIPPGPVLSEFKGAKVATKIESGSIFVNKDTVVAKAGDVISAPLAGLLSRLGLKPIKAGISVNIAYMDGLLFREKDIAIDPESYLNELKNSFAAALGIAVQQVYLTKESTPLIIAKGFRNAKALAVSAGYISKDTATAVIADSEAKAKAILNLAKKKGYQS